MRLLFKLQQTVVFKLSIQDPGMRSSKYEDFSKTLLN